MGYVFQMFNLLPYLTVNENILFPLEMSSRKRKLSQNPVEECRSLLGDLQISDLENKKVTELSIGQQQRVAVARSLMGHPELIIADEPTSALDHDNREAFLKLLFATANKNEATILFVSHDHTLKSIFPSNVALRDINQAGRKQ